MRPYENRGITMAIRLVTLRTYVVATIAPLAAFAVSGAVWAQDAQADAQAIVAKESAEAERIANTRLPADSNPSDKDASLPNPEDVKKRAGEQVGGIPLGKSIVLGMHVQEAKSGRVMVVEVGAATPAFDAGIQPGDEIVSFKGLQATTYRKWIDGMAKLASSAPDGSMLPVVVLRQGKQVATEIRVPEGRNARLQLPVGPSPVAVEGVPATAEVNVNNEASQVLTAQNAEFAAFFQGDASQGTERAMAQLVRIGAQQLATDPAPKQDVGARGEVGANWTSKPAPPTANARIGLAGFRNTSTGMMVMVDVGALPAGTYAVGISDPSVLGQRTTLDSDKVNPSSSVPTGHSSANLARNNQINEAQRATAAGANGVPMYKEIGTLTVDQSGTGRMQQTAEAMQVRDVVGQAIVLYSPSANQQQTLPPNLDPTTDPAAAPKPAQPGIPLGDNASVPASPRANASALAGSVGSVPVVGGIIRMIPDHQPLPSENSDQATSDRSNGLQPASNAPAVAPGTVR